jgi:hypothetical protein
MNGPGYYDDDGRYVYGEADAAAPGGHFSDLLNKGFQAIKTVARNVALATLSSDPDVRQAAIDAMTGAAASVPGMPHVVTNRPGVAFAIEDSEGHMFAGWDDETGMPLPRPATLIARSLEASMYTDGQIADIAERVAQYMGIYVVDSDDPDVAFDVRDRDGNQFWFAANSRNGGPVPRWENWLRELAGSSGSMINLRNFVIGDGTPDGGGADDSAGIEQAIARCVAENKPLYVPNDLACRVTRAINWRNVPTFGDGGFWLYADKTVPSANFLLPPRAGQVTYPSDVAVIYSKDAGDWILYNFNIDSCGQRAKGFTLWGGSTPWFSRMRARNSASTAGQVMGSRRPGDSAVIGGEITACIFEGSYWGFVIDGRNMGTRVHHNEFINNVQRHVSIDPNEAYADKFVEHASVVDNLMRGRLDIPDDGGDDPITNWTLVWPDHFVDAAIGSTGGRSYVDVMRNTIVDWRGQDAIRLDGSSGNVRDNTARVTLPAIPGYAEDAADHPYRGKAGLHVVNGSRINAGGNTFVGSTYAHKLRVDSTNVRSLYPDVAGNTTNRRLVYTGADVPAALPASCSLKALLDGETVPA